MKALIINADDFALSDTVSQGIVQAWRQGIASSTSALVTVAGAQQRITTAPATLPMGLHLSITLGTPLSDPQQVASLIDDEGKFYDMPEFIKHLHQVDREELRLELYHQAECMQAWRPFDHLDYHHHIFALYQPFFSLIIELAKDFAVPVRQPAVYGGIRQRGFRGFRGKQGQQPSHSNALLWRYAREGFISPYRTLRALIKMAPQHWAKHQRQLNAAGVATPDYMISDVYGNAGVENFRSIIAQLPEGISELVVHPAAEVDDALRQLGGYYVRERIDELELLCSSDAAEILTRQDITLLSFADLPSVVRAS